MTMNIEWDADPAPRGGLCVLSPDEDASADISSPCLRLVATTQYTQQPTS